MNISILTSALYVITTLSLCGGFLLIKKSDKVLFIGTWLPVTMIALMGYQTMVASIINFVNIPVNIISAAIANAIPAVVLWMLIVKKKEYQKYTIQIVDIALWVILIAAIVMFAGIRYGENLTPSYNSIDASVHFTQAMNIVNNECISSMFFAALHNAFFIEVLGPLFSVVTYYKIFVLGDVLYLLLGAFMFWGLVRKHCQDTFMKCAGMFATVAYIFAYPLNSTLFGFSYFGLSLTVITCIMAVADMYLEDEISEKLGVALLSFGCVSVFQAYLLFMPVVFFSLLICMLVKQFNNKKLISKDTVFKGLGIFLLPTIIGLWYTFRGFFGGGDGSGTTTVKSAIAIEGGVYGDLFSNFIVLIPLAIFGWWMLIKNKKNSMIKFVLPLDVIFILVLFIMALQRDVSAYYYYKNYYLLWLFALYAAFLGVNYLEKQSRFVVAVGTIMWVSLLIFGLRNMDAYVIDKNPLLHPRIKATAIGDIYIFNRDFLRTARYSEEKIDIYRYVREEILDEEKAEEVLIMAYIEDQWWYDSMTNQRLTKYQGSDIVAMVDEKSVQYVVILYDKSDYVTYQGLLDSMHRVYENSAGYIIKVY